MTTLTRNEPLVEETYAPTEPLPPPAPSTRRRWLIALAIIAAFALLLGGGIAAVVLLNDDEPAATQPAPPEPHQALRGEPALIEVPGYIYGDLQGDGAQAVTEQLTRNMRAANARALASSPTLGRLYQAWSVHEVLQSDEYVGLLYVMDMNQAYFEEGLITESILLANESATLEEQGSTVTMKTIAGTDVVLGQRDGATEAIWYMDGYEYGFSGPDRSTTIDYVTALINAQ